jgi:hypothetical protein
MVKRNEGRRKKILFDSYLLKPQTSTKHNTYFPKTMVSPASPAIISAFISSPVWSVLNSPCFHCFSHFVSVDAIIVETGSFRVHGTTFPD